MKKLILSALILLCIGAIIGYGCGGGNNGGMVIAEAPTLVIEGDYISFVNTDSRHFTLDSIKKPDYLVVSNDYKYVSFHQEKNVTPNSDVIFDGLPAGQYWLLRGWHDPKDPTALPPVNPNTENFINFD